MLRLNLKNTRNWFEIGKLRRDSLAAGNNWCECNSAIGRGAVFLMKMKYSGDTILEARNHLLNAILTFNENDNVGEILDYYHVSSWNKISSL